MKRFLAWLFLSLLFLGLVLAAAWQISPSFREKTLVAGLASSVTPLQKQSADSLKRYPSKSAAIALIAFINVYAPTGTKLRSLEREIEEHERILEDEELSTEKRAEVEALLSKARKDYEVEKQSFDSTFERDNELANTAVTSLCVLSGHSFTTHAKGTAHNFTHSSVSKKKWYSVVSSINLWAARTFGAAALGIEG